MTPRFNPRHIRHWKILFGLLTFGYALAEYHAQEHPKSYGGWLSEVQLIARAQQAGVSSEGIAELIAARYSTVPFHSLDVAISSGWPSDLTGCLDFPDGYMHDLPGAMGHHFINLELFNDGGILDHTRPEALLYETQPDGSLRLTAVEYVIPERDLARTETPPVLFGRALHFHPEFEA